MRTTYFGEVVAKQEGMYELIVFKNLDEADNSLLRYVTVTRLPNGEGPNLEIGDIGYIECEYVNAGETYGDRNTQTINSYNYSTCYFIHFVPKKEKINVKEFNF